MNTNTYCFPSSRFHTEHGLCDVIHFLPSDMSYGVYWYYIFLFIPLKA